MKKFLRVNKSSYSVFTVFIFLMIFSIVTGVSLYFINSLFDFTKKNTKIANNTIKNNLEINKELKSESEEKLDNDYVNKFILEYNPNISILLVGLGKDSEITEKALSKLPNRISFGFSAYSINLNYLMLKDKDLFLNIPMETPNYLFQDRGPYALLGGLGDKENLKRLDFIISRSVMFNGFYTDLHELFTNDAEHLELILKKLSKTNKLIIYNDLENMKPFNAVAKNYSMVNNILEANLLIDNFWSEKELITQLDYLKEIAVSRGYAVGIVKATQNSINTLSNWIKEIDKKLDFNIVNLSTLNKKINSKE